MRLYPLIYEQNGGRAGGKQVEVAEGRILAIGLVGKLTDGRTNQYAGLRTLECSCVGDKVVDHAFDLLGAQSTQEEMFGIRRQNKSALREVACENFPIEIFQFQAS